MGNFIIQKIDAVSVVKLKILSDCVLKTVEVSDDNFQRIKRENMSSSDESDSPDDSVPPKKNRHVYGRQLIIGVCDQLKKGVAITSIANQLNISIRTIVQWRDRYILKKKPDVTSQPRAKKDRKTVIEVCNRWGQGESSRSMSRSMGLNMSTLRTWKLKYYENKEPIPINIGAEKHVIRKGKVADEHITDVILFMIHFFLITINF